jgi:hypothetical protein
MRELIVDFRKQQREHTPTHIDGTAVEKVESFKFLGVHITDYLKWISHTDSVVKKVQQCLFKLRRLKKFVLAPKTLTNFYRCTIESILSGCITTWYRNRTTHNRVVCPTHHREQTTCPSGRLHHLMSKEDQKDHQGHQPPEPRPAIIQKIRSVQVHQS